MQVQKIVKNCEYCGKEFKTYLSENRKYCSRNCYGKQRSKKTKIICKECKKEFYVILSRKDTAKFCSKSCSTKYYHQKHPEFNQKIAEINKKNKTGFWNPETGRKGGRIGGKIMAERNRKNKTGFWNPNFFKSKEFTERLKKSVETNRKNKTGMFSKESKKKAHETQKRNKTGLWDFKVQSKGGKIGGETTHKKYPNLAKQAGRKGGIKVHKMYPHLASQNGLLTCEIIRKNKPYIWKGVHFDSKTEMKVAKLILSYPIDGVNCHIKMKKGIIDFFPQENDLIFQNTFVEFHPWDRELTIEEYYEKRRKILDNNNYKNYNLIVLTQRFGMKSLIEKNL